MNWNPSFNCNIKKKLNLIEKKYLIAIEKIKKNMWV